MFLDCVVAEMAFVFGIAKSICPFRFNFLGKLSHNNTKTLQRVQRKIELIERLLNKEHCILTSSKERNKERKKEINKGTLFKCLVVVALCSS